MAVSPVRHRAGRSLSLRSLARCGAVLLGRANDLDGDRIRFDDSAAARVAAGDAGRRQAPGHDRRTRPGTRTGDFSWLEPSPLGAGGRPRRDGAAAPLPGLWYLGLRRLTRRGSGLLHGMPTDATTVAQDVRRHLERTG